MITFIIYVRFNELITTLIFIFYTDLLAVRMSRTSHQWN